MMREAASEGARRAIAPGARELDPIAQPGTAERVWQEWSTLGALPELPLTGITSAVVVAAHPDDETLGLGGTLSVLADSGVRLRVVVATDGEASHPASRTTTPRRLADLRRSEDEASLAALGAGDAELVRLSMPDGGLSVRFVQFVARLRELTAGFDVCVVPWSADMHPDHESAGRAALTACSGTGTAVWQYPVWMWHWAVPGDVRVPWDRAARIELPAWAWVRKQEAVSCHASQIFPLGPGPGDAPVLAVSDLEHFRRRYELVLL
jgi:LmbE family N-acetylglucosaminyl deacetylase